MIFLAAAVDLSDIVCECCFRLTAKLRHNEFAFPAELSSHETPKTISRTANYNASNESKDETKCKSFFWSQPPIEVYCRTAGGQEMALQLPHNLDDIKLPYHA